MQCMSCMPNNGQCINHLLQTYLQVHGSTTCYQGVSPYYMLQKLTNGVSPSKNPAQVSKD